MYIERQPESSKVSERFRITVLLLGILIVIVTLALNALFLDSLYKEGVNIIYKSQQLFESQAFVIINNVFSMFCHPVTVALLLMFQLSVIKHKLKALIHISFFLLCIYLIALLKQVYQQSRPIWSSGDIKKLQWFCPKDFGNPSGHSFAVLPLYEPIISKYIGFGAYHFGWMFLVLFSFFVPFSRTYLGVHSYNQIMFGLTLGVAVTMIFRYGVRQQIYHVFTRIYKKKCWKHLAACIALHLIFFFLPFLFYQLYSENRPMDKEDVDNLNQFCVSDLTSILIQESMLLKCTMESFIFGICYGLFFLEYTEKNSLYFAGRWEYSSWKKAFFHIFTIVGTCGLIALIFVLIIPHFIKVIFFDYLVNTIGMILAGFSLVYIIPKVEHYFEWIDYSKGAYLSTNEDTGNQGKNALIVEIVG